MLDTYIQQCTAHSVQNELVTIRYNIISGLKIRHDCTTTCTEIQREQGETKPHTQIDDTTYTILHLEKRSINEFRD